jgi:predicted Zn finger-like uncharacterized protein
MLIVCPNCKKRFDIDPGTLGEARKLRCSSCKAVFRLVRKPAGEAPAAPVPEAAASPVPQAPKGVAAQPTCDAAAAVSGRLQSEGAPQAAGAGVDAPEAPKAAPLAAPAQACTGPVRVVVANESAPFCDAVRKVLSTEPFEIFVCDDGKVALDTVLQVRPQVLLLDVALPTMFGFEVCERVRQNPELSGVRIVLIASIYDKTRYKRSPNSLYGADDYIEKHHIPDALVPMVYRLASGSLPATEPACASDLAAQQEVRTEIREVEQRETSASPALDRVASILREVPSPAPAPVQAAAALAASFAPVLTPAAEEAPPAAAMPAELSEPETKARRLARIIVSDIVLYNQGKVEKGVREGSFYDLLADDIREGERLYRQRVPELLRENTTFLQDAFEDLIAKKRAELRM